MSGWVATALGAGALLLFALCIPYQFTVERKAGATFLGMSLFGLRFGGGSAEPTSEGRGDNRPQNRRRAPKGASPSPRKVLALLLSGDFVMSLARLVRRVAHQLRPRRLRLRIEFGLGDPFDTGCLWGALSPLILSLRAMEAEEVWLEPDFLERRLDVDLYSEVRVIPIVLLAILIGYLFTPAPWRATWRYLRA